MILIPKPEKYYKRENHRATSFMKINTKMLSKISNKLNLAVCYLNDTSQPNKIYFKGIKDGLILRNVFTTYNINKPKENIM